MAPLAWCCVLLCGFLLTTRTSSCSNFLVSSGATEDGSTHIAYNSDGQSFYGYMTHLPAGKHPPGTERKVYQYGTGIYMGVIPEAAETFNVIGNMNEHQVAISETTFDGLEQGSI
jgi:dipeptidase